MADRIIFLDIDGVLVSQKTESIVIGDYSQFDPDCVAILNQLTEATGAKLVLSSSWRIGEDIADLRGYFNSQGVTGELIDMTGVREDADRELEILEWLDQQSPRPRFVILDDDPWFKQLAGVHVQTIFEHGLQTRHHQDALRLFEA